ncbi:nucleotidyltransferase domain-containing protein [Aeromicrobium erythreum]|jgi:predicted nucleotidyltransferase|uniref:Cro/Cl family transcriptional regulator n=1 Tax=Aeromicrobium erythreum TaxID=2041 RepID=A0A0U3KF52_9ACTN|nr:nucleotidyltransferase domain-containing protein [Aeromicrobium erythreum]ALX03635.1 Cro/Cl family transcriptional regulator [Aeromicrobium erythreum]
MTLLAEYLDARRDEDVARLRRKVALRALASTGASQRDIAAALGISQPAVSQQLATTRSTDVDPATLVEAAAPVLVRLAHDRGFSRLAVFGSVSRGQARPDSDIDLLVEAPTDAGILEVENLRRLYEQVLGRPVDLVTYGGLDPLRDADVLADATEL